MGEKLFADQRQLSAQPPAFKQSRTGQLLQLIERFDKAGWLRLSVSAARPSVPC